MKGAKSEAKFTSNLWAEGKFRLNYIEIPVLAAYKFVFDDELSLQVKAGPYFAYGVSGKSKVGWEIIFDGGEVDDIDSFGDEGLFERFDCGLNVGVEFNYKKFVIGASYENGFVDVSKSDDLSLKNRAFMVSLGYNF